MERIKLLPTKKQLDFLDWEFGVFFHFGIRTFYRGHVDWDGKEMPANAFNPKKLNCEQWIRQIKKAGAKYAIMTTKHHDGFALWPSNYSNYSVKNSPYKNGKGDIVKEYTDACRKYGIKVGLYYSPAQWGGSAIPFSNEKDYDDYFINQITELLTNYGKIDYLWFDCCGSENHVYDKKRITDVMFKLQPDLLTFCDPDWFPCVRWVGNEDGYAPLDNPLVVSSADFSELATEKEQLSKPAFIPSECDCKIRSTWFFDDNEDTVKSVEELFGMYQTSVGHGSNFLLNISPNDEGLLPKKDNAVLQKLGKKIRDSFSTPLDFSKAERKDNSYEITHKDYGNKEKWVVPDKKYLSNCLVIKEDLTKGQSVFGFKVYAYLPWYQHVKVLVYEGRTIGHKAICTFNALRASKYEVEITDSDGEFNLTDIKAYYI